MMAGMRKPTPSQSSQVCHVAITLDEVVPKVSRLVAVPLGIRLDMLHLVIQAAMGWTNTHMWLIQARGLMWGEPDPDYPDDTIPASRTLLLDMIADVGTNRFTYVYDFGDQWSHTIKITKPLPAAPGVDYPLVIEAVGRCPLEDSGGADGYMEMIAALRDPAHPRHGEVIAWPGPDFDPTNANRAKLERDVADLAQLITPRRRSAAKAKSSAKPRKPKGGDLF